jgi:Rrf2 family cysteine metabolism transcriptional repressor
MLTVSTKGIYGLTAMYELASRQHNGRMFIGDIAAKHNIPKHYLEQLLIILKKSGFVRSFRGKEGGYALAKTPDSIKIVDILESLEGKVHITGSNDKQNPLSFFWKNLEDSIKDFFNVSLQELLMQKQNNENKLLYSI